MRFRGSSSNREFATPLVELEQLKRRLTKRYGKGDTGVGDRWMCEWMCGNWGWSVRGPEKRDIGDAFDTECQVNSIKADDNGSHTRSASPCSRVARPAEGNPLPVEQGEARRVFTYPADVTNKVDSTDSFVRGERGARVTGNAA